MSSRRPRSHRRIWQIFGPLCLAACARGPHPSADRPICPEAPALEDMLAATPDSRPDDPHSQSNPHQVRVRHMGFDWDVNFDQKQLRGSVKYLVERIDPDAPLRLDTDDLIIDSVFVASMPENSTATPSTPELALTSSQAQWGLASWTLGEPDPVYGRVLEIKLPPNATLVEVRYHTPPHASGLQWLDPAQSADGKTPFLYTQSQAILGRTWIPTQDTPSVRITYDAKVRVPAGLRALMSADILDRPPAAPPKVLPGDIQEYRFRMEQPIPNYLIALAVGNLEFGEIGPRSGVWAAPNQLAAAKYEMGELEQMITRTENIFGPYRWDRYDVLILPPAFPMGGMENPRLTFATPTILAGDRSLTSLIAHELAHSWSGNLVTNANWNDIWLNEGFTTYAERRIVEALYGRAQEEMEAMLGRQDLMAEINENLADRPEDQRLAADATGRDPDSLLSDVAYEKGALFLRRLEECYGRETFDPFLRRWFDEHAFQTATTEEFVAFLRSELIEKAKPKPGQSVPDLQVWLHEPGLPADAPSPQSDAFQRVDQQVAQYRAGQTPAQKLDVKGWNPQQWLHFLRAFDEHVSLEQLAELDAAFAFTKSKNSEIVARWLEIAAQRRYQPAYARLEEFLVTVGRRKFLVPIYRALLSTPDGRAQAKAIFERAKPGYHSISRESIAAMLEATPASSAASKAP